MAYTNGLINRIRGAITNGFSLDLAIDLGSTNTLIFQKGVGIVVDEPSVIAFWNTVQGKQQVAGVGAGVRALRGQQANEITVVKPVDHGTIADFSAAREMLENHLGKLGRKWLPASQRVIASVPVQATNRNKESFRSLIRSAGASEVYLIEEPRALALGAGMDIALDKSAMVIDVGGHLTEMSVMTEGRVVCSRTVRIGGENMDKAIARYFRAVRGLHMEDHLAEMVKIHIGEAWPGAERKSIHVEGMDLSNGTLRTVEVTSQEICEALAGPLGTIVSEIRDFLGTLCPEQYVDILDRGIMLAGGGAMLGGFDRLLEHKTLMPVVKAQDPLACVVLGTGNALDSLDHFRQIENLQ